MSDEERDLRKYSRRSAIGLMGVGGGLAATETLGFTNVTAGRDAFIGIDDDDNAILESTGSSNSDDDVDGDPLSGLESTTIDDDLTIEFTNRSTVTLEAGSGSEDLTVTIDETADTKLVVDTTNFDTTEDIGPGGLETYNIDSSIQPDESATISLESTDSDTATIDVEIDVVFNGTTLNANRNEISINDTSN